MTLEDFWNLLVTLLWSPCKQCTGEAATVKRPTSTGKDGIRPCSAALRTASCFAGRQSVPLAQLIPHSVSRKPLQSKARTLPRLGRNSTGSFTRPVLARRRGIGEGGGMEWVLERSGHRHGGQGLERLSCKWEAKSERFVALFRRRGSILSKGLFSYPQLGLPRFRFVSFQGMFRRTKFSMLSDKVGEPPGASNMGTRGQSAA